MTTTDFCPFNFCRYCMEDHSSNMYFHHSNICNCDD